ncbi:MAG TPA: hypothetical protein VNK81_06960, partial [Thermodesulfobacteriota bacterium]|nr:hypothetical protein [Thermodesulfobacteriota bacterium]
LLKKQLEEKSDQVRLIDETRREVKEILNTLQVIKKDGENISNINNKIGAGLGELLETIQGFKEQIRGDKAEFTTREDLERFISTINKLKEEELEKAAEEAGRIIREAQQRADDMIMRAESEVEAKREEASLIINEAQQRADELIREAESQVESKREQAALIVSEAQKRAESMILEAQNQAEINKGEAALIISRAQEKASEVIRDAESQAERMRQEGLQIIREAQQKARTMVDEAQDEVERKKEEAAQVMRDAQQRAGSIIREAKNEEEDIRIAILDLKKQHRLFRHRMKEIIEFHLSLLDSSGDEKEVKESDASSSPTESPFLPPGQSPFSAPKD